MKKLATILATAILGTSSLALAQPVRVAPPEPPPNVQRRDHRDGNDAGGRWQTHDNRDDGDRDDRIYFDGDDDSEFDRDDYGRYWRDGRQFIRAEHQPELVLLGSAGAGKSVIRVGADAGRFQSLRLDVSGWMRVRQVLVRFADGTTQLVRMRTYGNDRRAPLVIDFQGNKRINAIIVYAGHYGRGTVTVTALEAKRMFWRRHAHR